MSFQHSERIGAFLNAQEELEGFWHFMHRDPLYDACRALDDSWDDFQHGFELAKKAGNQPVFECDFSEGDLYLYFIGEEDEVLNHLKAKIAAWLEKNPQEPPEAKALAKLRESKAEAERQSKSIQAKIRTLENQEKLLMTTLVKKKPRRKKK